MLSAAVGVEADVGVAVAEGEGEEVTRGTLTAVADGVAVTVADGEAVTTGNGDAVAVGVAVGVADGTTTGLLLLLLTGVAVKEGEAVGRTETVGDGVAVVVTFTVATGVAVTVGFGVVVIVGVGVGVGVVFTVGVGVAVTTGVGVGVVPSLLELSLLSSSFVFPTVFDTSKVRALLPFTETWYAPRLRLGTLSVREVALEAFCVAVKLVFEFVNVMTLFTVLMFLPLIVIDEPTVVEAGLMPVIVGIFKVKVRLEVVVPVGGMMATL